MVIGSVAFQSSWPLVYLCSAPMGCITRFRVGLVLWFFKVGFHVNSKVVSSTLNSMYI
jgi:hypothetical protein